jgi:hypothetical protein
MIKNILAIFALVIVAVGGALIIQKGGQNLSQISPSSQLAQVPTTGLVGYYSFDEGSGSTASGATINGATWTTGKVGGALSFNGSGNNVNVGSDVIGTGDDSVCAWVYPKSLGNSGYSPTIFSNGRFGLFMLKEYPSYKFSFTNGTNFPSVGLTDLNKWTHVCVSRSSSGSATVYVNGSVAGTVDGGTPAAGYNSLFIGNRSQGDQGFDGIIDEVRIYNKTLTQAEVTAIYNYSGTTTPLISSVSASAKTDTRSSNATITWTTNESSDSQVEYGLTTAYGSNTTLDTNLATAHSQVLLSLSPSTTYHFRVKSKDSAGNLAMSPDQTFVTPAQQPIGDLTPPSTPAKLVASVVSATQINLTWSASTDTVGVTGYRVYRNGVQVGTTATASYSDTGLTAGTAYTYTVAAYDAAGNLSNQSTAVSATTQTSSTVTGKFKIGDRVQVTNTIAVRSSPTAMDPEGSTNKLGTQAINTIGTVSTGTTYANPSKSADGLIWSYIDYDNSTLDGWSTESYLSAYVAPTTYSLTIIRSGTGTGTVTATCGTTTCPTAIPAGTSVKLTAVAATTPTPGSSFSLWSGISGCSTSSTCTFTINANTSVTAVFTQNTPTTDNPPSAPTLSASVISATQINLTWTPSTDDHGINGYYVYRDGSNIANVTTGLTGTTIAFSNTTLSAGTTYTYTVAAYDTIGQIGPQSNSVTKTTTANPTYTITPTAGANGTISPAAAVSVASGGSQAFTITPNSGYKIATVTVDGASVAASSPYTFTNVTASHTISATFSAVVSNTPTATLTASPSSVTSGSASTITWSSANATSCTGTGFSTGNAVSGSVSTGALTTSTTYGLTCTGANGSVTATPVTVGVTVPGSAYQLPAERSINWIGSAGIPGGIPTNRTTYQTIPAGASQSTIQTALNSAPANTVVMLSSGTYSISNLTIPSNVTLRGAGPGLTILNTTGSSNGDVAAVRFGPKVQGEYTATAHDISSGYTKGSTSIVLNNTTNISVGTLLVIDQLNDSSLVTNNGTYGTISWNSRNSGARVQGQTVEVKSISGNTVTFDPPLYMTYKSSLAPQAMSFNAGATMAGLENLTVKANGKGYTAMIAMDGTKYSWVKGVETDFADGDHMDIGFGSFRNEVRNSYFHDGFIHDSGSVDTDLMIAGKSSANLIENNIFYRMHVSIMLNWGASGNVLGYNFSGGAYHTNPMANNIPTSQIQDMSGNHGAHPMFNLWEGNIADKFHEDSYWGSSSHNIYFRNFGTGETYVFPPYNSRGTWQISSGAYTSQGMRAFATDYQQQYTSWIGNIAGSNHTINGNTQKIAVYAESRPYQSVISLFSVGYGDVSDAAGGSANKSSKVYTTLLMHGNWDSNSKQVEYKSGELTTLPSSMYLTSKPAWFGSTQWPSIGPDISGGVEGGGHVVLNPAGKCFTTYLSTGTGRFDPTTCYGQ